MVRKLASQARWNDFLVNRQHRIDVNRTNRPILCNGVIADTCVGQVPLLCLLIPVLRPKFSVCDLAFALKFAASICAAFAAMPVGSSRAGWAHPKMTDFDQVRLDLRQLWLGDYLQHCHARG